MTFPILTSERLLLRQILPSDINKIFEGLSHPSVIRHYGVQFNDIGSTQSQMDWYDSIYQEETGIWWAIIERNTQAFIGAIGINHRNHAFRKAELGYWLLPDYWGKGYVPEALYVVEQYVFNELNIHRLEGYIEPGNTNSCRVMHKCGWQLEGTMRDCEIKDGKFLSLAIYAKLNTDKV